MAVVTGMFLVAAAVALPARATAAAGDGSIGVRLLEVTESLRLDPRARQYIIDHLVPGTTIDRRIEVANNSDVPRRIGMYPGAATVGDGEFRFAEGRSPNELTTWTSLDKEVMELAPHSVETAVVTITVPLDASPGEHYGVIWAQTGSPSVDGTGLQVVNRVGIRVYLDIGPGGPAPSAFTMSNLIARRMPDGRPAVTTDIHNTGGRALDMTGELTLSNGPGGLRAGPFHAKLGTTIGAGEKYPVSIYLDPLLPAGPWTATVTLRSGLVERVTKARLRFPDKPGATSGPLHQTSFPFGGITGILTIAASGALAGVLVLTIVRVLRRRHATRT